MAMSPSASRSELEGGTKSMRALPHVCPTSAKSDALGLILDCGALCMVHIEMAAAVESLSSTDMLEPISAA